MNQGNIENTVENIIDTLAIENVGINVYSGKRPTQIINLKVGEKVFYPGTDEYRRAFSGYYLSQGTTLLYEEFESESEAPKMPNEPDIIDTSVMLEEKRIEISKPELAEPVKAVSLEEAAVINTMAADESLYPPMETSMLVSMKKKKYLEEKGKNEKPGKKKNAEKSNTQDIKEQNHQYLSDFIRDVDTEENKKKSDEELMYMAAAETINADGYYNFLVPDDQDDYESGQKFTGKEIGLVTGLIAISGGCIFFIIKILSGFPIF